MSDDNPEKWLEVLAGKSMPNDPQTRQAAALRNFFELQEQHTAPLEEATQRRILNALEAKGVFAQSAPTPKPAQTVSLLSRALNWLFPQGHDNGGRYAAAAAAVLAVLVVPFMVLHSPTGDDDPGGIKSLQSPSGAPTAIIDSATPDQLAAQLITTLARHGVLATLRSEGADRWVQAQIAADRLPAVQADLVSMGLAATPAGELVVQFRKQP